MITASIVLYNTDLKQLNTVIKSYAPSPDRLLFLIDNSENCLDSAPENPYITYLFNNNNLGYGAAHNIGIRKAIELNSDYHVVLNPDLEFDPSVIDELKNYADANKDVVYMLPKVVYPNGELQYLCKLLPTPADLFIRRFLPNVGIFKRRNDRYVLKESGYDHIMNPPCLSGCFMFMRVKALVENQLFFDENYFMYCEDFDLIRRLHKIGKTLYYPKVCIIHDHKKGSYKNFKMLIMHVISTFKYFKKFGWFFDIDRKTINTTFLDSEGII